MLIRVFCVAEQASSRGVLEGGGGVFCVAEQASSRGVLEGGGGGGGGNRLAK